MRRGERSEGRGGGLPQRRRSAGTPQHGAMPEAGASLLPPAAAGFLSGAPPALERPDLRQPPRKRGKRRRGWASFKNKTPKALAAAPQRPHPPQRKRGRSGRRTRGRHDRRATAGSAGRGGRDDRRRHDEGSGWRPEATWRSATRRRAKAGRPATAVRTRAFERRRAVCFQARHERKQTACRSGRLLPDGVAVRW